MEHQLSFVDSEYQNKHLQTRKEIFLARMDKLIGDAAVRVQQAGRGHAEE